MSQNHGTDAPVPRDHDKATFSEILPIRSGKINLRKSPLLSLGLVSAVTVVVLFGFLGFQLEGSDGMRSRTFLIFSLILIAYFLFLILWMVRVYARSDRTMLYYAFPFFTVVGMFFFTPIFYWLAIIFRGFLPGGDQFTGSNEFIYAFTGHFFGAGLLEELFKGIPVLIGMAITIFGLRGVLWNYLRVRGPLDGVLAGLAAGAGFIFFETGFDYIPRFTDLATQQTGGNVGEGIGFGLSLLIPRVFQGLSGHMAWSALFGYFIGLAVLRPKSIWILLPVGWLLSSLIHGLWNSVDTIHGSLSYVIATVGFIAFLACLLKARQLEATIFGRGADVAGASIVVDQAAQPVPAAPVAPAPAAPQQPQSAGSPAPQTQPTDNAATQPVAATMQTAAFTLNVAGKNLPLENGRKFDLDAETGKTSGVSFEVTQHPRNRDVFGLKNTGSAQWSVTLADGSVRALAPGKNVRLSRGVKIDFAGVSGKVD